MYQKALGNTGLKTLYVDGFDGTGEIPIADIKDGLFDEDVKTVLTGSADRALGIAPPFNRYVFIDKRKKCIDALKERFDGHANDDRVSYLVGDANERICGLCAQEKWRFQRGVILLDPFGSQVEWATIKAIAATEVLDLWYLFPAGLSIFRQIGKDGTVDPTHESSITRIVGTEDWREAFVKPSTQGDLFGKRVVHEKVVTPESAADFMIERLKTIFKGGVLEDKIPLGKHAYPSFYLLFAWGNPTQKATALARKLGRAAIKATDRKHGRLI